MKDKNRFQTSSPIKLLSWAAKYKEWALVTKQRVELIQDNINSYSKTTPGFKAKLSQKITRSIFWIVESTPYNKSKIFLIKG